jgi:large subunit ribosomal protein L9
MKVILTQEVLGLGDPGEVVTVKNGYGRNYLVPRGLAIEATNKNIKTVEAERERISIKAAREAGKVADEAGKLKGTAVTIKARAGESGKLYGSVTNMDIAAALAEMGFDIDRRRIILAEGPLKSLGEHTLPVKLHPHVVVDIQVTVEAEYTEEELAAAAARQKAAEESAAAKELAAAEEAPAEEATEAEDAPEAEDPAEEAAKE